MAKAIPEGYQTVTPYIVVRGASNAIDFYKKAFGAKEMYRMPGPDGKSIAHAEIKIGNSVVMLGDENPAWDNLGPQSRGGVTSSLFLYVEDVDAAFDKAVKAGGTGKLPPTDMFWGDRFSKLVDPFGQEWGIATHKEDLSPQEIEKRGREFYSQMMAESKA